MSLPPPPRPGQVIAYAYLWAREHRRGLEEGRKDRPCAVVAARQVIAGREAVTVVPITHTEPDDPADAIQIPAPLKAHLGLDEAPAWIVVSETNDFLWPGPDIRPGGLSYGMLPPRFFAHVRDRLLQAHLRRKLTRCSVRSNRCPTGNYRT